MGALDAMLGSLAALRHRSLGEHARNLALVGAAAAEALLLQVRARVKGASGRASVRAREGRTGGRKGGARERGSRGRWVK